MPSFLSIFKWYAHFFCWHAALFGTRARSTADHWCYTCRSVKRSYWTFSLRFLIFRTYKYALLIIMLINSYFLKFMQTVTDEMLHQQRKPASAAASPVRASSVSRLSSFDASLTLIAAEWLRSPRMPLLSCLCGKYPEVCYSAFWICIFMWY